MWLQERVLNGEKGKEEWTRVLTFINTPPTETRRPTRTATATGPVPVLPPSQHATAFAAFAGFGA